MATFFDTTALDALLIEIRDGATVVRLLDQYSQGDTIGTINTNTIGYATITSGDFTGPTASGQNRRLTFDGASGTATANSSVQQLHIALTDGTGTLTDATTCYAVTDETSDQPITDGNPITWPSFYMQSSQPTQV